jgi:chromosome segregation ATPase
MSQEEELRDAARRATGNLHKVTKICESHRQAWKVNETELESKLTQMDADARDIIKRNNDEIARLTKVKQRLELWIKLLQQSIRSDRADNKNIRELFRAFDVMQEELDELRTKNMILEERIENTLESVQQERDHWDVEYMEERHPRTQVDCLQQEISDLKGQLVRWQKLTRILEEEVKKRASSDTKLTQGIDGYNSALTQLVNENEKLRDQIEVMRKEKTEVHLQANRFDDLNLDQAMRIEDTGKLSREQAKDLQLRRKYRTSSETEFEYLTKALKESYPFSTEAEKGVL